jgi:hypothetical protein
MALAISLRKCVQIMIVSSSLNEPIFADHGNNLSFNTTTNLSWPSQALKEY